MIAFRCPHCQGEITFDPTRQSMTCSYCGSEITMEDYKAELEKRGYYQANELTCTQCGARILSTDTTVATFCSFCGSPVVLENRVVEEKRPDRLIPFKVTQKQAAGIYRGKIHKTLLAPDWMTDEDNISKFRGIYMPFHIFRFTAKGPWKGQAIKDSLETIKGTKYDVRRTYDVESEYHADYSFMPADASAAFPDGMSRAVCPYYENTSEPFSEPYLSGFYADSSDVSEDLYDDKYESIVLGHIGKTPTVPCGGVQVRSAELVPEIQLKKETKRYMLPVWFLSIRNRDKVSYAAVNGQTGELAADIPISFKKYLVASTIVAGLISVILNLFFTVTPVKLLSMSSWINVGLIFLANRLLNSTYRRTRHLDDAGYTGVDKDKVKYKPGRKGDYVPSGIVVVIFIGLVILGFFEVGTVILAVLFPLFMLVGAVAAIVPMIRTAKGRVRIKKKKAPLYYKFLILIKPVLAVLVSAFVSVAYSSNDDYCYLAALFAILMIILTCFDVVRLQNKYTMRDLPLFNEKRGGDL